MERLNRSSAFLLKAAIDSGITSPSELSALMGNASVESAGFTRMREDFGYTTVGNVLRASASAARRYTIAEIQDAIDSKDPQRIATVLYEGRNSGRNSLGNSEPGDGWRFHGRGYFQFTGRYNYKKYGDQLGIDLVSDPEKAMEPEVSARLALAFWAHVPELKRDDAIAAGEVINGGTHAAEARQRSARAWARIITPDLVREVQSQAVGIDDLVAMGSSFPAPQSPGKKGVESLQSKLNRLGYVDAAGCDLRVDGDYGRRTRLAVEDFQRRHGLVADGIAGPLTLAAVDRAVKTELRSIGQPDAAYLRAEQPMESLSVYRSLAPEPIAIPSMPVIPPDELARPGNTRYLEPLASSRGEVRGHLAAFDRSSDNAITAPASFPVSEARSLDWQDPRHPRSDLHDLYNELGRRVPDASEDRLLQFTAVCHESCITAENLVEARLDEQQGTLTFIGTGALTQPAHIDLKSPPPYPEEAMQQIQQHDLQQQQVMEQVRSQQAQMGMSHSR